MQPANKLSRAELDDDELTLWVDELPEQFREVISREKIRDLLNLTEEQRLALIGKWYGEWHQWDNEEQRKARRAAFAKRASAWRMWREARQLRDEAERHNAKVKIRRRV
jgi:hypothetical protein